MKVTLQVTKKPKRGSIELEAKYEGKDPVFVAIRGATYGWIYYRARMDNVLSQLCPKLGINHDTWTKVWVRLQVKEQSNDISQKSEAKEEAS